MSDSVVLVEHRDAISIVTINRPQALNALNADVLAGLDRALDEIAARPETRAVVLTGAGRAFVAGADISQMAGLAPQAAEAFAAKGQEIVARIAGLAVPVIAAVNGHCLGGGCELAMACDLVLAGEKASFGQPEVKLGVIPGFGGTQRLVRRVGVSVALDLCLTGRVIDADEAVRIGIASRKLSGDTLEAALVVAGDLAKLAPVALQNVKRAIHENADADLRTGLAAERSLFALCFATVDQKEGMAAFLEKRPARFLGR
jgi:enoyl-CoA hydratase